jgi:hypothetical protein
MSLIIWAVQQPGIMRACKFIEVVATSLWNFPGIVTHAVERLIHAVIG